MASEKREKSPAFQFYPREWDTDMNVIPMTYEEEGVYWALCRLFWLHGWLPAKLDDLRLLLKGRPSQKAMTRWWVRIGRCWVEREGRLYHPRLERERAKQEAWKADQSARAKEAADAKWAAERKRRASEAHAAGIDTAMPKDAFAFASASASAEEPDPARSAGDLPATEPPASAKSTAPDGAGRARSHRIQPKEEPTFAALCALVRAEMERFEASQIPIGSIPEFVEHCKDVCVRANFVYSGSAINRAVDAVLRAERTPA